MSIKTKLKATTLASLIVFEAAGCSNKMDPNERNFGAAISAYLEKKGDLCLNSIKWPKDTGGLDYQLDGLKESDQLQILETVGLVSSETIDRGALNNRGESSTGTRETFLRYELTEKGRSFFHADRNDPDSGELCYGKKALDTLVKWDGPLKIGDYQVASIRFHYKVVDLADWAKDTNVQVAYPAIKRTLDGAGTSQQSHSVKLTNVGWEAVGIDN